MREHEQGRGRGRGTEIPKGALCWQQQAPFGAGTHKLQDHDLSWDRMLNLLNHPGTPYYIFNLVSVLLSPFSFYLFHNDYFYFLLFLFPLISLARNLSAFERAPFYLLFLSIVFLFYNLLIFYLFLFFLKFLCVYSHILVLQI